MTAFWIMTALATAMAALLVLTGARRGVDADVDVEPDAAARELAELDRLKSRGLLTEEAWTAARAEAGRRLLATRSGPVELKARPSDRRWVLGGVVLTAVAALGLYWAIGKPGYGDQTYDRRVDAWGASAEPLEAEQVAAVLTREAKLRPDDRQILTMLGAARFAADDPVGAASAFRRALALNADDPRTWARLGESLVRSQDGAVGADAEAAFREALKRDPGQLGALYFLGDAALTRGDRAGALALWTPLIKALDPADPRRAELQKRLASGGPAANRGAAR
jgi:cytochrome c-type biogenesis protein CcmH